MQDQHTADGAPAPAAPRGRYILTAVLDGASDVIARFMGGLGSQLPALGVDLAGAECLGPLAADHPAQSLPVIPAPEVPSAAPGVLLDLHPDQESVQLEPDGLSAPATDAPTQQSADGATEHGASETDQGGAIAGVVPPNQDAGDQADQSADHSAADSTAVDSAPSVALPSLGTPVEVGAVVADQGTSGEGSPAVSASGGAAPAGTSAAAPAETERASGDPAPTPPLPFGTRPDASPPSAAEISAAISAGVKLLTLSGDTASALVLAFLGYTQARLDPAFDGEKLKLALIAAVGALDTAGDSASGDVISQFGAFLFADSWGLPLIFDPPVPATTPEVPAETPASIVDASTPHPDPTAVNPNAR